MISYNSHFSVWELQVQWSGEGKDERRKGEGEKDTESVFGLYMHVSSAVCLRLRQLVGEWRCQCFLSWHSLSRGLHKVKPCCVLAVPPVVTTALRKPVKRNKRLRMTSTTASIIEILKEDRDLIWSQEELGLFFRTEVQRYGSGLGKTIIPQPTRNRDPSQ